MESAPLLGACAAFLIVATLYASQAVAVATIGSEDRAARWAAAVASGVFAAFAAFHLLSALGRFRLAEALLLAVVATLAVRVFTRVRFQQVVRLLGEDIAALLAFVLGETPALRPLRALLAVAAAQVVLRALILPPLGHDTITYHGVKAGMWVQSGGHLPLRLPGAWNVYRHYSPGEVLGAWAMLPFHDDTLYLLVDVMEWLAWVPALVALCGELGVATRFRAAVCIYALTCGAIYYFIPSGYVDVTLHLILLSTIVFGMRVIRGATPRASAALALGCALTALSVKMTAIAVPAIVGLVSALALRRHTPAVRWSIARGLAIGCGIGILTAGPVLLRNAIELGYPFSPYAVKLLGITLGRLQPELGWYIAPKHVLIDLDNELLQLGTILGVARPFAPTFGAPALLLLLLAPFALFRLYRQKPLAALLIGSLVAYQCSVYFLPDFAVVRTRYGYANARFFALVPIASALLAPLLFDRFKPPVLQWYLMLASALSVGIYAHEFPSVLERQPLVLFTAIVLTASLAVYRATRSADSAHVGTAAVGLLCVALVFGTGPLRDYRLGLRYPALALSVIGHPTPTRVSALAPEVDDPDHPHRIAVASAPYFKGDRQLMYYYLGAKLQNELTYVSVMQDGGTPVYDRSNPELHAVDPDVWVQRVRAARVSHVLVLAPEPEELAWMKERSGTFELVGSNEHAWLFRVRDSAGH